MTTAAILVDPHDHQWVTPRIAVGSGIWTEGHVTALRNEGVTHVLDCRSTAAAEYLFRDGVPVYCSCPTDDDGQHKPPEWFHRGVRFALAALALPGARLLVVCAAGVNRSPSMAHAILRVRGMSASASERAIRLARPLVQLRYLGAAERAAQAWPR